jgi:hypothetical protein
VEGVVAAMEGDAAATMILVSIKKNLNPKG